MNHNWALYIAAFATAFSISLVTTPFAKKVSLQVGAIDYPKKRGMHKKPMPRLGGIAIVLGFMITITIMTFFLKELRTLQFAGFMLGAIIIVCVGIVDDIKQIRAKTKLAFQIIAALVVIFTGTRISISSWPFAEYLAPFSAPITLIWIIGVTNAVNLIDGVDGLAAGVTSISALCLTVLCVLSGTPIAVVLATTLAGSCFGFLPRNFSPAEVIMGDTGALFLGFVLSVSSLIGVFKTYALLSVVIACFSIALPIFDTLFAMIRRFLQGKPILEADRGHLHHRLIDSGLSTKRAVLVLYGLSIVCSIFAVIIALQNLLVFFIALVFVLILGLMLYVYRLRTNKTKELENNIELKKGEGK